MKIAAAAYPIDWFDSFADYEANKIERLGPEAARPHASRHRRLIRD